MLKRLGIVILTLMSVSATAQRAPLVPPQTINGLEFVIRSVNLAMIPPGPANSPQPTVRFSIAITNRGNSSRGLLVDASSSGASTDSGLDLKQINARLLRGLQTCEGGACTHNILETAWTILQPGQTNYVLVPFWTILPSAQVHRRAETIDLSLVLLTKESGGSVTRVSLSEADIPMVNEIR